MEIKVETTVETETETLDHVDMNEEPVSRASTRFAMHSSLYSQSDIP
jgi:hypothetical protein